jgi:cardiolipin synthase (CMP-forming)
MPTRAMITSLPNMLTLSRIVFIPVLAGVFLFVAPPLGQWLAFALYAAACATDFLDGYFARSRQLQSSLGRLLDPIADKLFVAAVIFLLVAAQEVTGLSILAAAIILCREIVVSGLREFLAALNVGLPVSRLSKWKTGIQMVAMGILLIGDAGPAGTAEVGIAGLWLAALLTVVTGWNYFRVGLRHVAAAGRNS